jgi:NAD+ synthase (glutamine-hydrolysing)
VPLRVEPRFEGPEELFKALALGTRDYVLKNGFKKVLIGLSGGIDSALVAAIAVEALGKDCVVGLTMPSRFTSQGTRSDAHLLAKNLGIKVLELPIEKSYVSYLETLAPVFKGHKPDVTEENIQARIRGNLLMALSNKFGWLVLTTGNKSEIATGYCTLYGDMAGGFAVIKDVPKTIVYKIANFYNKSRGKKIIPDSVIKRPPSAELRFHQKDQDTLPPYEVLDPIIQGYIQEDLGFQELVRKGFPSETVRRVIRMIDLNEYKRRQAPPGIKITPRAFARDWRLPITNHYNIKK